MTGQATVPAAAAGMPPLTFPMATMMYFQFVFAAITVIILAGSLLGRMNFKAWVIFCPLWMTLVYTVGAFSHLGRRLAGADGRAGLFRRLRHPSGGGEFGLCRGRDHRTEASGRPRSFPAEQPSDDPGGRAASSGWAGTASTAAIPTSPTLTPRPR